MPMKFCVAGLCAAAIALMSFNVPFADAATQKKKAAATTKKVAKTPPRSRITVQRRSFLEVGTYSLPGDHKYTDYAVPPYHSPASVIDNRAGTWRSPLPGPYDLPSPHNPWPWHW